VPDDACVLVAIVDMGGDAEAAIASFAEACQGCPSEALPPGCVVAAAIGQKGEKTKWSSTMAGLEVAIATCPVNVSTPCSDCPP